MKNKRLRVDRVVCVALTLLFLLSLLNGFKWANDNPYEFRELIKVEQGL